MQASNDGNTTLSTLTFVPTVEDSGQRLTCRAATSYDLGNYFEDSWVLNVYHVPLVNLDLHQNLRGVALTEGMDVTLECGIRANPWVYRVSWKHNGKNLYHNASAGTVITNQTLVFLNVSRSRSGVYSCTGSNQEGDGESDPLYLDIKYLEIFDEVSVQRVKRSQDSKFKDRNRILKLLVVHQTELLRIQEKAKNMIALENKKIFFLKKLENSQHYRKDLLYMTSNQSSSQVWFKERAKRLTASYFGRVCAMKDTTSCKVLVWNILYNKVKSNKFIEHGKNTEPIAKEYLFTKFGYKVKNTGMYIDKDLPFLAASPDGLIDDDLVVEIKCPYFAGYYPSPQDAVRNVNVYKARRR
uniref:Ig-like domain-containing protein n=1 Tax=Clastoptera arizonana TaxID=38151 RepID=A0A1B6E911_9HEMI